jgi:hypothetical protein
MPISAPKELKVPYYLFNRHLETIIPSTLRRVSEAHNQRLRLETPDDDFLDVDHYDNPSDRAVVISHGLEGSSDRPYVLGAAKLFHESGWNVFAWNCRSCSGEMNRQFRLYHHGDIEDLSLVIDFVARQERFKHIVILGFSMGGSMTLRYAGIKGVDIPGKVKRAIAFSVPVDLAGCSAELEKPANYVYKQKFIRKLSDKIRLKDQQFPGRLRMDKLDEVKKIRDFDEHFTAPMYGFTDADDFYAKASSGPFIPDIRIPTLLVNALNDPFLPESCYPYEAVSDSPHMDNRIRARTDH